MNSLRRGSRSSHFHSQQEVILSILSYDGEGIHYFFFELAVQSGLIDRRHVKRLGEISAWAEFGGCSVSLSFKGRDLNELNGDIVALSPTFEIAHWRGNGCSNEIETKMAMKKLLIVRDSTYPEELRCLLNFWNHRSFLADEEGHETQWRHDDPPQYDLVNKLYQQERTKIFDLQHHMGLLLLETKEFEEEYAQMTNAAMASTILRKRDQAAHASALAEENKREESLRKALRVEKDYNVTDQKIPSEQIK
ncbi:unnamed protein product [Linum tenue]|uniref:Uncharacterized protein n=1 Tax=Linum tenue TaxID=586396 RepID=A0AAV0QIB7_9ROSI|nr:unnamed protein product [Linum tenue]